MADVVAALVARLLSLRHHRWQATVEAPAPGPGRRSSDARLEHAEDIVLTEVESRVGALESIVRECHDKRRAVAEAAPGRRVHVVLVLPPTRHHRALVRAHPETIRVAFPVPSARLVDALSSRSGPWPGDGILWLSARATSSA